MDTRAVPPSGGILRIALLGLLVVACRPVDRPPPAERTAPDAVAATALERALWDQRAPSFVREGAWPLLRSAYNARFYAPYWVGGSGVLPRAGVLLREVCRAPGEGLPLGAYPVGPLVRALERVKDGGAEGAELAAVDLLLSSLLLDYGSDLLTGVTGGAGELPRAASRRNARLADSVLLAMLGSRRLDAALAALHPPYPQYVALTGALQRYRAIDRAGGWPTVGTGEVLRPGARGERVRRLRVRLAASGDLTDSAGDRFDAATARAVRQFQARTGLRPDGVVGARTAAMLDVPAAVRVRQIEGALERLRWLPAARGERHLVLDLVGGTLAAYTGPERAAGTPAGVPGPLAVRMPRFGVDSVVAVARTGGPMAGGGAVRIVPAGLRPDGSVPPAVRFLLQRDTTLVLLGPGAGGGTAPAGADTILLASPEPLASFLAADEALSPDAAELRLRSPVALFLLAQPAAVRDDAVRFLPWTPADSLLALRLRAGADTTGAAAAGCAAAERLAFELSR